MIRRADVPAEPGVEAPAEDLDDVPPPIEAPLEAAIEAVVRGLTRRLTRVGWLSLITTAVYLVANVVPIVLAVGSSLNDVGLIEALARNASALVFAIGSSAIIAMPAALELGGVDARRAVPWLMRGSLLLALATLASLGARTIEQWIASAPEFAVTNPTGTAGVVFVSVGFVPAILTMAGDASLLLGIARAGSRPDRRVLALVVSIALAITALSSGIAMLIIPSGFFALTTVRFAAGMIVALTTSALSAAVAVHLVAGRKLAPRRAWQVAGVAGIAQLLWVFGESLNLLAIYITQDFGAFSTIGMLAFAAGALSSVCLAVAFALGLGRQETTASEPPDVPHPSLAGTPAF